MENEQKKSDFANREKKMTRQRLQNIALYYLQRFDSSKENLRDVLKRRILKYGYKNSDFSSQTAFAWVEEIINDFERWGYLDDNRYAEQKIADYLAAGKSEFYIRQKLIQKGIDKGIVDKILSASEIDEEAAAMNFARKKKIGPYRKDEEQCKLYRVKDIRTMLRAGFGYDIVQKIIGGDFFDENI